MKLQVEEIALSFDHHHIMQDVSFYVENGEFVSILGSSGCGKSTLLNIMAGVLQQDAGRILVDGKEVTGLSSHFAYMPQSDLLLPWYTILENVCLYGKLHHQYDQARKQALNHMEAFGLKGYAHAYPKELSGGMRQRAAFLRTALCSADILLLDEPFGALDVITRGDMQDWLMQMRSRLNRTTLLVTHDIDEAVYLSDRILILSGAPSKITASFDIREKNRTREWLYHQSELRTEIYQYLKGDQG